MLKFQREIISQCLRYDGLWILAPGLGIFEIIEMLLNQLEKPERDKIGHHPPKYLSSDHHDHNKCNITNNSFGNEEKQIPCLTTSPPRGIIIVLNLHPESLPNTSPRKYPYVNADYNAQQRFHFALHENYPTN
jgi:hypothetical protein